MGLYRFRQTFRIFGQVVLLQQLQRVSQLLAQIGVKGAGPLHQALGNAASFCVFNHLEPRNKWI